MSNVFVAAMLSGAIAGASSLVLGALFGPVAAIAVIPIGFVGGMLAGHWAAKKDMYK